MLNFVLVGCGRISKRHSELLGFNQIKGARLVAVCDSLADRARTIGARFSVPYYIDMHQMMRSENVDVVVVLTESGNHARNVFELSQYRKHIVVEKPMALTVEDAESMVRACTESNVKLFVVKQNRFNLPIVKLRAALDDNRFGKLILGTVRVRWCRPQEYYDQATWRGTWSMDGGVLANQASHHVDMLLWMMGEVESVFARGTSALAKIEAEDTAVASLKFKSGALGVIEATTATRPRDLEGSISVLGELGAVEVAGFALNEMRTWNFVDTLPDDDFVKERFSVNPPNVYGFGHQAFYEHVVDSLLSDKSPMVDGTEGLKSVVLLSAIYESMETGEEVPVGVNATNSRLGRGA